jgi:uncharacterized protein
LDSYVDNNRADVYTIARALPTVANVWQYRVKQVGDGQERAVSEQQLAKKDFFAAIGRGDREGLLALVAEDVEWIIPGEAWPLAGTRRGHAGLADLLETPQGDRVLVVGFARGKVKATNRTFEDHFVFAITVQDGKLTNIREYIDTQALARASEMDASSMP